MAESRRAGCSQPMWLHSWSFAVATASAFQVWPRHAHNHLPRSQNGLGNGTLWLDDRVVHGQGYGEGRLKGV